MHPDLDALLATHADTLRPLLGPLWPVRPFKVEQFGPLTKYTLGQMPDGRWAMLHCLTEADAGWPHDHPCDMESHGIKGSYCEQVFTPGGWLFKLWGPGSKHSIGADCIHRITKLYDEQVWTLCFAGPVVREWQHYPELEVSLLRLS